jgi:transcriptional regulator with XRE-family HTH domain
MVVIMPSKAPLLYPSETKQLRAFGERLKRARLIRRFSAALVAERSNISRQTLTKAEQGNPNVTLGVYLRIMAVVGLRKSFDDLGAKDPMAEIFLQHGPMEIRIRAAKKAKPEPIDAGDIDLETSRAERISRDVDME